MMRDSERAEKTAASRAEKRAHEKVERVSIAEPAPAPLPEPKKPTAQLPKRYNVGANIAHLEHIRPMAQAIGMALAGDGGN